jgi:photosystem II stability/assembly factor-like uncharacterized protein
MRKKILVLLFLVFVFPYNLEAAQGWKAQNRGLGDADLHTIALFNKDKDFICAASSKFVYLSKDGGSFWQDSLSFSAKTERINFVAFQRTDSKGIYAATSKGLYASQDQGESWQRIFYKVRAKARNVTWVGVDPLDDSKIYIGTEEGLFISFDSGITWQKQDGGLAHSRVRFLAIHPYNGQELYLANNLGLFKSPDAGKSWERILVSSQRVSEDEQETLPGEERQNLFNSIAIDKNNPKRIFLASGQGILISDNSGASWRKMPSQGLSNDYVNFVVSSSHKDNIVYAATEEGVYKFSTQANSWSRIEQGLTARKVRSLALSPDSRHLFAATENGFFSRLNASDADQQARALANALIFKGKQSNLEQVLDELSVKEPSIRQVQEAALRYAQVIHPDKIKTLRRNAKLKALLPDISVDYDKTVSVSTNPNYKESVVGPRDWSLSFSWDVGDLVFSEQVRLIDSNTRLLVQLRDDILDEVNRLYYERRRLQTELILTPPQTQEEKLGRILRLEELTADIDALTGGYFSRYIDPSSPQ